MCGGGVIEGQGEVQQKPARAVAPETRLARLMERELHLAIHPSAFRRFIVAHWSKISALAHQIHDESVKSDG
jgi:hypothetical protein